MIYKEINQVEHRESFKNIDKKSRECPLPTLSRFKKNQKSDYVNFSFFFF